MHSCIVAFALIPCFQFLEYFIRLLLKIVVFSTFLIFEYVKIVILGNKELISDMNWKLDGSILCGSTIIRLELYFFGDWLWYVSFVLIGFINCWLVQDYLNVKFKETGHSNMYFPQVELLFQPVESSSFDICFPCELEFHCLVTVSVTWNMKFLVHGRLGVGC